MLYTARRHSHLSIPLLAVPATALLALVLGAVASRYPAPLLAASLFLGLFWLALARPVVAFVLVVVLMALPFTWTPSLDGHFLTPSIIGGLVFVLAGIVRRRWFTLNVVDAVVFAFVLTSVLSAIANGDTFSFPEYNFESILVPYIGWRMLFASCASVRKALIPCLVAVGTAVAIVGLIESANGSGLFTHILVNPRLSIWAQTYFRAGQVRIAGPFGQPLALGMFLLIPIGFAIAGPGRMRFAALALIPAEILTLSRGPWIATLVLVLLLLPRIVSQSRSPGLVVVIVLLIGCTVAFAKPIADVVNSSTQIGTRENANALYRTGLLETSIAHARPLGTHVDIYSYGSLYGEAGFKDVASWYALTLGETGWLGLVSLLALFGAAATGLWRGYRDRSPLLLISAAVVLAQMLALTTAPPITNYGAFLWLSVACLASSFITPRRGTAAASPRPHAAAPMTT